MRNPLVSERSNDIGLLLARLPVGAVWVVAGCIKIGKMGVNEFVKMGKNMIPAWLPRDIGVAYLHALPFAEVLVGLLIFLGLVTRVGGLLASLIMISILIATKGWLEDPAKAPMPMPSSNLILLGICLLFLFMGGGKISLDGLIFAKKGNRFQGRGFAMN